MPQAAQLAAAEGAQGDRPEDARDEIQKRRLALRWLRGGFAVATRRLRGGDAVATRWLQQGGDTRW